MKGQANYGNEIETFSERTFRIRGLNDKFFIGDGYTIHAVAVFYERVTASTNFFALLRGDKFLLRRLIDTCNLNNCPVRRLSESFREIP